MLTNRRTVRIEWADCDAAGIVFYPNYFAIFDSSTHYLFERAGWKKRDLIAEFDIVGYPMVDTRAKFMVPSTFGDDIVVETRITAFRSSSFDVEHKVYKPGPDGTEILALEGFETRVWVGRHPDDPTRIKSRPIPEEVIRRLSAEA